MKDVLNLKNNKAQKGAGARLRLAEPSYGQISNLSVRPRPRLRPFFKKRWYIPAGFLVALIVIILSFYLNIFNKNLTPQETKAAWFNDSWHYRQQFDVFNASTTENLVDFQIKIATSTLTLATLFSENKLKNDFTDLRFTDASGNLLDYWHPDATSTMRAVYVKFSSLPKNATSTLFMYYNNPSAEDVRKGNEVFEELGFY